MTVFDAVLNIRKLTMVWYVFVGLNIMAILINLSLHSVFCICVQKYSICSTAKKMTGVSAILSQWWYVTVLSSVYCYCHLRSQCCGWLAITDGFCCYFNVISVLSSQWTGTDCIEAIYCCTSRTDKWEKLLCVNHYL